MHSPAKHYVDIFDTEDVDEDDFGDYSNPDETYMDEI